MYYINCEAPRGSNMTQRSKRQQTLLVELHYVMLHAKYLQWALCLLQIFLVLIFDVNYVESNINRVTSTFSRGSLGEAGYMSIGYYWNIFKDLLCNSLGNIR